MELTVLPTVLATLTAVFISIPVNPSTVAVVSTNLNAPKMTSIWLDYTNVTKLFVNHDNTDKVLKQQLVGTVNLIYVKAI